MSNPTPAPQKPLPDDALPPVTPPAAGFILQLFLIPMVIVMIIVTVWMMFSWLAHMGSDPADLVRGLKKGDAASWQKAGSLANLLRNPQYDHLKLDRELAGELGAALDAQIDSGLTGENQIKLRMFTCRALGEFKVPGVLPPLMRAATVQREDVELDVRKTALEAIAVLVHHLDTKQLRRNDDLFEVLKTAANERTQGEDTENRHAELRSAAAFVLGVLGGERALDQLDIMLGDPYANTRYNAATGLARHGDARAIPGLIDMLDPENEQTVDDEEFASGRDFKRTLVMNNAAHAVNILAQTNTGDDLSELSEALESLIASGPARSVAVGSKEALQVIRQREAVATPASD